MTCRLILSWQSLGAFLFQKEFMAITGNTLGDVLALFGDTRDKASGLLGLTGAALGAPELNLSEGLRGSSSSSGASRSFDNSGTNQNVPTTTPALITSGGSPVTKPTPVPAGTNLKDPNTKPPGDGWFWDAADGWKQAGGGSDADFLNQINDIYNNSINYLSTLEGNARNEYGQAVDSTGKAYGLALQQSQAGFNQNIGQLDENRQELETDKRSALSEAIRAYNALNQARMSRFGGGSSAGEASSEILGAESIRQQAGIENAFLSQVRDLERGRQQLILQQKNYEDQLELQKQDALSGLKTELDTKMAQIQGLRVDSENARAQMRMSAVQDTINRARNVQLAFNERAANIREAVYTKMSELDGNYNRLLELAQAYDSGQYFDPYASNQYSGVDLSQRAGATNNYSYNPYAKQDDDSNPFYQPTASSISYGASASF